MKIIIILIIIIIIVSLKFYKEKTIKENFTLDSGEAIYNAEKTKIKFVNHNGSGIVPPDHDLDTEDIKITDDIKINASPEYRESKKLKSKLKSKSKFESDELKKYKKKSEKDNSKKSGRSKSNKNRKIRFMQSSNLSNDMISQRNKTIDYKIEAIDNRNKMITKTLKNMENVDDIDTNKMIRKSLKNLDDQKKSLSYSKTYFKKSLDPNERLEKTLRPNKYEFINKDNVEPKIRDTSEDKSCYTHIKPGKNIFHAYGYSYMPPEVWSVPQDRPPVCIPQKGFKAEAVPLYTTGTPLDALEIQQTLMPKFKYEEVYDPKYYYPGWISK